MGKKVCFIVSPIGPNGSDIRKAANDKMDFVYSPVLEKFDYEVIRADKENSSTLISRGIIKRVVESQLVIADVTGSNANVYYELAIRNAAKKPLIIIKHPSEQLPFDIFDKRAISLNMEDPRQWTDAKALLEQHIRNAEASPNDASESIVSDYTFIVEKTELVGLQGQMALELKDIKDILGGMVGTRRGGIGLNSKFILTSTSPVYKVGETVRARLFQENIPSGPPLVVRVLDPTGGQRYSRWGGSYTNNEDIELMPILSYYPKGLWTIEATMPFANAYASTGFRLE